MEELKTTVDVNHNCFINQLMNAITGLAYIVDENHILRHYNEKFRQIFNIEHLSDFDHNIYEKLAQVLNLSEQELANFQVDDNAAVFSEQIETSVLKMHSTHPGVKEHYKCVRYPIFDGGTRYLVVQMTEASNDEIISSTENISHAPKTSQNSSKILLADPIEVSRMVIKSYFEELSEVVVECALSEKEALEMFEVDKYSLIVTETDLADGPGYTLIKKIRKREKGTKSHVPIIAITEHKPEILVDNYKRDGADGIIYKNIDVENAHKLIEHYVKGKETAIPGLIKLSEINLGF